MAWWQKRLLRYALSRTGLLDDSALDPEKLDIALGKKNVIELKDVRLNIKRVSKLAQLPPGPAHRDRESTIAPLDSAGRYLPI